MALIIERLAGLIAPVLCHMAEDIWQNLPYSVEETSVFHRGWPTVPADWRNAELSAPIQQLRELRAVNKVLEDCGRQELGASLEAAVRIDAHRPELQAALSWLSETGDAEVDSLRDWLLVSQLQIGGEPWAELLASQDDEVALIEEMVVRGEPSANAATAPRVNIQTIPHLRSLCRRSRTPCSPTGLIQQSCRLASRRTMVSAGFQWSEATPPVKLRPLRQHEASGSNSVACVVLLLNPRKIQQFEQLVLNHAAGAPPDRDADACALPAPESEPVHSSVEASCHPAMAGQTNQKPLREAGQISHQSDVTDERRNGLGPLTAEKSNTEAMTPCSPRGLQATADSCLPRQPPYQR